MCIYIYIDVTFYMGTMGGIPSSYKPHRYIDTIEIFLAKISFYGKVFVGMT